MKTVECKKSLHAVVGSLEAVLNFLEVQGVDRIRMRGLRRSMDRKDYTGVMDLAQEYVEQMDWSYLLSASSMTVSPATTSFSYSSFGREINVNAIVHLFESAWECLCQYMNGLYSEVFKSCHTLRKDRSTLHRRSASQAEIKRGMELLTDLAERCTCSRKGIILVRIWEKRLLSHQRKLSSEGAANAERSERRD